MEVRDTLFIGGEFVKPAGTGSIDVISPATEEVIGRVPDGSEGDIDSAVAAARKAFDDGQWPWTPPAGRAEVMARLSQITQGRSQDFAQCISSENGSPISWSIMGQVFAATMA